MFWDKIFKKKKEENIFDNLVLSKLKPGYLVDYDMKTYRVAARNRYAWQEGGVTDEWELHGDGGVWFLERSEDDGYVEWSLCQKVPIAELEGDVAGQIIKDEDPPEEVVYQGKKFRFMDDDVGEFFRGDAEAGLKFVAWDFEDETGETTLTIEQWGETKFDMQVGFEVEEYQFINILPGDA
ncbi:MAG: DUF4178 domain-containing protein [Nitrospinaceae bacterium]